jgi:hypothetical protein
VACWCWLEGIVLEFADHKLSKFQESLFPWKNLLHVVIYRSRLRCKPSFRLYLPFLLSAHCPLAIGRDSDNRPDLWVAREKRGNYWWQLHCGKTGY